MSLPRRCCPGALLLLALSVAGLPAHAAEGPRPGGAAPGAGASSTPAQTLPVRLAGFLKTLAEHHAEPPELDAVVFAGLRGVVSRDPAGSVERDGGRLLLRGRAGVSSFDWPPAGDPDQLARLAVQVLGQARLGAVEIRRMKPERIEEIFLRSALESLGPRAVLLSPRAYAATESPEGRRLVGLGIEFETEPEGVRVTRVYEGSAGATAGLQVLDLLVAVDGRALAGMDQDGAVAALRAKADSEARIEIRRGDTTMDLRARRIHYEPRVDAQLLPNGVAWLRIPRFGPGTGADFAETLSRLHAESGGRLSGMILDLRDNNAGTLHAAVGVGASVLPAGAPVVTLIGPEWGNGQRVVVRPSDYLRRAGARDYAKSVPAEARSVPMAVLVNAGTAQIAEVLAAALQENGRAAILGRRTLGYGSVLKAFPLGNGAGFRIPVTRFLTPAGVALEGIGVSPDLCGAGGAAAGDCPADPSAAPPGNAADEDLALALALLADRARYDRLVVRRLPDEPGGDSR